MAAQGIRHTQAVNLVSQECPVKTHQDTEMEGRRAAGLAAVQTVQCAALVGSAHIELAPERQIATKVDQWLQLKLART